MLHKRKLARGKVRVTFSMPALEGASVLFLAGDFNEWSETAAPLARAPDGSWSVSLTLDAGREYQFRYLDDLGAWHNDWAADAYAPNDFGSDNSVLNLKIEAASAPAKKTSARRKSTAPNPRRRKSS